MPETESERHQNAGRAIRITAVCRTGSATADCAFYGWNADGTPDFDSSELLGELPNFGSSPQDYFQIESFL